MRFQLQHVGNAFAWVFFGILPFVFAPQFLDPVRYPQLMLIGVGCLLLLGYFATKKKPSTSQNRPTSTKFWWLALPLAGWTALSMIWAMNAAEAWFTFVHLSLCLAFFHLARKALAEIPDLLFKVVKALVVSMGLLAILGLLQWLGFDPLKTGDQQNSAMGTMTNPNFYADALLLGLPFCIYGLVKFPDKLWKILATITISLILAGIAVSKARSSLLPLLLAAIVVPPIFIWRKFKGKIRWSGLLTWIVLLALALWLTNFIFRKKEGTFNFHYIWECGHAITPKTSSVDFRFITWHHSLHLFAEKPFTGCGAGNWKMEIQRMGVTGYDEQDGFGLRVPLQPHHEYIGLLAELGIPGLFLVLGIGGLAIWRAGKMAIAKDGKGDAVLGTCLLLGIFFYFFDANFSFPTERPFQSMILFWMLALAFSGESEVQTNVSSWQQKFGGVLCGLVLIAGCATLISRLSADRATLALRTQKDAHQAQKMLKTAQKAQNWSSQIDQASAMPIDWYVGMAHQELGNLPAALASFERALAVAPHHFGVRSGYASLLDMAGRSAEAAKELSALLLIFPGDNEGWLNLTIMQIHAGQWQAARQSLSKLPPSYSPDKYPLVDKAIKDAGY
jgi:O-antigen ligase